jgi:hypothetical protein
MAGTDRTACNFRALAASDASTLDQTSIKGLHANPLPCKRFPVALC